MKRKDQPPLLLITILTLVTIPTVAQPSSGWRLEDGKAMAQKAISIPGKSSATIYKEVSRWLVKQYHEPEELIKARIEEEYIRGIAYHADLNFGSSAALHYTFIFNISDEKVTLTLTDAVVVLVYSSYNDELDQSHRIEEYLASVDRGRRRLDDDTSIVAALVRFSDSLFESFEKSVLEGVVKL